MKANTIWLDHDPSLLSGSPVRASFAQEPDSIGRTTLLFRNIIPLGF